MLGTMRSRTKDVSTSLTLGSRCTMGFLPHRCPLGWGPGPSLGRASCLWCRGIDWLRWDEWFACRWGRLLSVLREEGSHGLWRSDGASKEHVGAYRVPSLVWWLEV